MARISFEHPVRSLQGKIAKDSRIVYRQKHSRLPSKAGTGYAPEAYCVEHPRDYRKNPPRGNELAHLQAFRKACLLTKQQLADPAARNDWELRFRAQLSRPDKEAPADPVTGKRKIYRQLPSYVRATILREIKAAAHNIIDEKNNIVDEKK